MSIQQNLVSRSRKRLPQFTTVLYGLTNSQSFRVVTVSEISEYATYYLIELWDAASGSLLWEKEVERTIFTKIVQPSFSEDGKYLVVYDDNWVEIVNAHSAQSTGVVPTRGCEPVALAVANNGKSLAVANNTLEAKGFGPGALFEKSFLDEGRSPIDLISLCGFSSVQLCYASNGSDLIMAGHFQKTYHERVVMIFWDVKSCSTLRHVVCGSKGSRIDGPIQG